MSRRPSSADRRARLARRIEALEAMEPRSLITESLGILSLGIGVAVAPPALAGSRSAGDRAPALPARPRAALGVASLRIVPASASRLPVVPAPSTPEAATTPPAVMVPRSGDWLSLGLGTSAPAKTAFRHFVAPPPTPQGGGGVGGSSHGGGGATAPPLIAPLRIPPPPAQDIGTPAANAPVLVGAAPATGSTPAATSAPAPVGPSRAASSGSSRVASGGGIGTGVGLGTPPGPLAGSTVPLGQFTNFPLYTLDFNNGVVLFPGFAQLANLGGPVDLRAQVRDTTVSSYSWDTTNLTATGISGQATSRLQFTWPTYNPNAAYTASATLTVTNAGGQTEVQTYSFLVPTGSGLGGSGGGTITWPESLAPDLLRPAAPAFAGHGATVDANTGALDVVIPLPGYNPNVPPVVLAYDSLAADARPIVVEHHTLDPALAIPTQVSAQITFNGTAGSTYYYNTSQFIPGDVQQIALQADATALATGRYAYALAIGDVRTATTTATVAGTATVLNASASAFGAGWSLAGLEAITPATGGVILDLGGRGRSLWFTGGASGGGAYTAPAGEFSALVKNSDGTYVRTFTDGTKINFDTGGRESAAVDRNGLRVTYAYDGGGKLATISDPYGKVTTLAYDGSSKLQTVTDPAGRVATFTHAGASLTGVTLPDGNAWSYAYDGSGRLTQATDPRSKTLTVTYDGAGRASGTTRPDATAEAIAAYQERGWVAPGGGTSGSPAAPTLLAEARGSHTDPNAHTTDLRADWRGLGLTNQATDPDGNVATSDRDANGLATVAIDRVGRITKSAYDANGNVTALTYPDGYAEQYSYNGFAEVTAHVDPNVHTTSYTYDGNGNTTVVQDPVGNRTTMTYTANGRLATAQDARSNVTSYQYDSQDRLTTVTYPGGATKLLAYDAKGNATTVTDERSNVTTSSYDALNRTTGTTDALGNPTTYAYDASGNRTAVQAPLARTTTSAYDAMNRVTTVTDPLAHATVRGYDPAGNLRTVTDPLSRVTTFAYDPEDRRTAVIDPLGNATTTAYDAAGQATTVTDPMGRVTTSTYNARGWVATKADPVGNNQAVTYTPTGKEAGVAIPGPSGGTVLLISYTYDADDRRTAAQDALGHVTTTVYDAVGNTTATVDALGNTTTYAYDARNRRTTVTDPLAHATVTGYDAAGNRTAVTDPLAQTTTTAYDALNRATTITDARTGVTTIAFDAAGRRTGLTDPSANHTTWAYDAADRVTTTTDPRGSTATSAYDNDDELVDKTDRNGRRVTYAYDSGGRRVGETWVGASPAATITRTYDADNELTGVADANATLTFTYDSGGRQVTAATSSAAGQPLVTLTAGYNAAGTRTGLADGLSSAGLTTYAYDPAYRLTTVTRSLGGVAGPQVVLGYDNADRPTSLARTIGGTGTEIDTATAYDAASRVGTITHQVAGSPAPLATYTYGYDNANRLTGETNAEGTVAYAYDATNQLTGASGSRAEAYTYDSGGNRTMAGYATGTGNRLTSGAGYTYTYDTEGNQTGKTQVSNGNNWTYTWDYRNRLAGVVGRNTGGALLMQGTYTYDPTDRRIGVDETVSGVRTTTWTVYDGQNTYADFGGTGTLQQRYLHGPAVDQILARTSSGGTTAWYLTDKLGTVRDVANASGTVIDHVAYDSYGNLASESNSGNGDRFKFAGREYDAALGLYYDRARWYDPRNGNFVSEDPLSFGGGDSNLYSYVANDPTNRVDPTGLYADEPLPTPPLPSKTLPGPDPTLDPQVQPAQHPHAPPHHEPTPPQPEHPGHRPPPEVNVGISIGRPGPGSSSGSEGSPEGHDPSEGPGQLQPQTPPRQSGTRPPFWRLFQLRPRRRRR